MEENKPKRQFLGVMFECCHVYGRIYKSPDGTCYRGMCPKCGRPVKVIVGEGGTNERFFRAK